MPEKIDLYINEANDYARDIGAPTWHPHVSVVHYDEVGEIRHKLNRYNVYGLFLQREFPENLTYGIGRYHETSGSLLALSPGQIGGRRDDGTRRQYSGWVLLFDAQFIQGSEIERRLADYHFFSYNTNEALFLAEEEKDVLAGLMANVREELNTHGDDDVHDDIIRDYIQLILDYCQRFYIRQFKEMAIAKGDILSRFQQVLIDYYEKGRQLKDGLPSVKYCASELCLSAGYFGDIVHFPNSASQIQRQWQVVSSTHCLMMRHSLLRTTTIIIKQREAIMLAAVTLTMAGALSALRHTPTAVSSITSTKFALLSS